MNTLPRPEYPRPQMVRREWMNLNGIWQFEVDSGCSGRARGLYRAERLSGEILVPFCPESALSGVRNTDFMEEVWYRRTFVLPENRKGRTLLHIGACDYDTEVWVNGFSVGRHRGGYVSFSFDITDALAEGENTLIITAEDHLRTHLQPAGKQSDRYESYGCFYTRTTGIWQTVWLEQVPECHIADLQFFPSYANRSLHIRARIENGEGKTLSCRAFFEGRPCGDASAVVSGERAELTLPLSELHPWSPESPELYDLTLSVGEDEVSSYFGLRDLSVKDGALYINGKLCYQRLVLDQGFYPEGIYTAPTEEDLKGDILRSMAMGFNGARLHQKVFEPRFLYLCDKLGYIVWGEHGNWGLDVSKPEAWRGFLPEWQEILCRDRNHPALIGWCPLNETQRDVDPELVRMLYALTKALDPERPFIDGSGWTHVEGATDITDFHNYEQDPGKWRELLAPLGEGKPITNFYTKKKECPTFCSEYGGIWWSDTDTAGWGYGTRVASRAEYLTRIEGLTDVLLQNPGISAFCYTQLTDVEQEQNGLYTYDRRPKFDPSEIRRILSKKSVLEESEGCR